MSRRLGRRDKTPHTTLRVSVETRDRLMVLLKKRLHAAGAERHMWRGRQYGETALVTMDDVIRELLRGAGDA